MERIGAFTVALLLILVVAGASDAPKPPQIQMAEGKGADKSQKGWPPPPPPVLLQDPLQQSPPLPLPPPLPPKPELPSAGSGKSNGTTSDKGHLESLPRGTTPTNEEQLKNDQGPKGKDSSTGAGNSRNPDQEAGCDAASEKCHAADLVACLGHSGNESTELFLLVQNGGEDALTVNIRTSIHIDDKKPQVGKHSTEKISFSTNATDVIQIVLNAGKGDCILHIRPLVSDRPSRQFLAYATHLTSIHWAYFLFIFMVITGGVWACCKFGRKFRRGDSGIPYQQLEMGTQVQSSSLITYTNATDGWDQSWDDDWDEEEAAGRPSEKHSTGIVSSNGLTSRPPNKDGWDVDWDD